MGISERSARISRREGSAKICQKTRGRNSLERCKLRHSTLVHACSMSRPHGNINLPCWAKRSRRPVQADYIVKCGAPRNKIKRDVDVRCTCSKSRNENWNAIHSESSSPRVRGNSQQFVSETSWARII